MCRSRRELSNEYLLGEIGVDTAENEPLEVRGEIKFNIHSPPYSRANRHNMTIQGTGAIMPQTVLKYFATRQST